MCKKIFNALNGDIANKTIAVLGLAYKKNTDDMRYSPSLVIINYLIESKTNIKVYDPAAMENAQNNYFQNKNIYYAHDKLDALSNADALVILTEWDDFKTIDLKHARTSMAGKTFIDLRNLYERKAVEEFGFDYYCVGR
jgi:UDPglucose 6-dehydrogenase